MNTFLLVLNTELNEVDLLVLLETLGDQVVINNLSSTPTKAPTKGKQILEALRREASKAEGEVVKTRAQIADEIGCVVGRVAEIIKANETDSLVVKYRDRLLADREAARGAVAEAKASAKATAKAAATKAKANAKSAVKSVRTETAVDADDEAEAAGDAEVEVEPTPRRRAKAVATA